MAIAAPMQGERATGPAFPSKLPTEPGAYIAALQAWFLKTDPRTQERIQTQEEAKAAGLEWGAGLVHPSNVNDPSNVLRLLDFFDAIDKRTRERLEETDPTFDPLVWTSPLWQGLAQLGYLDPVGPERDRIEQDLAKWTSRKEAYRTRTALFRATATDEEKEKWAPATVYAGPKTVEWSREVVGPLLLGWYPDREQQTVADAVTPLLLARTLQVAEDAMAEAWTRLGDDLTPEPPELDGETFAEIFRDMWAEHRTAVVAAGVGTVVLGGGLIYLAARAGSRR